MGRFDFLIPLGITSHKMFENSDCYVAVLFAKQCCFRFHQTGVEPPRAVRGGDAEHMHGFADEVFIKHRCKYSSTISKAGICVLTRAFELDVVAFAIRRDLFAKQMGAFITKHSEMPKLMANISLSDGR